MAYDFDTALRRRLGSIMEAAKPDTTLLRLMQQKAAAAQQAIGATNMSDFSTGNAGFDSFRRAISAQESGGNYGIVNKTSGAMGKYQIMPSNISATKGGWDYEALGRDISTSQFLSSPELQEKIASYKLQQYYDKYGPAGAAVAWYAGPGAVAKSSNSTKAQGAYPSINAYKNAILNRMRQP